MTIREWMKADGLTAKKAAGLCGVALPYFVHLVARRKGPSLEVARRIVEASKGRITVHDLVVQKVRSSADDTRASAA